MAFEQMRWAELILYIRNILPNSKHRDQNEPNNHRSNHCHVRGRLVRRIDDSNECETDPWDDDCRANVVETFIGFMPWYAFWMLWRLVECENSGEREELSYEPRIIYVLLPAIVDSIL
jgi:hypothetical protein